MLCICGVLLVYSAVIIPPQLCLWNYDDPCKMFPTLYFDVFVDSFFLVTESEVIAASDYTEVQNAKLNHNGVKSLTWKREHCQACDAAVGQVDIILQFFTGVHHEDLSYCDEWKSIALRNLRSVTGFWFDVVTSIPFSYLDIYFHQVITIGVSIQRACSSLMMCTYLAFN